MHSILATIYNHATVANILDTLINALVTVFTEVIQKILSPILLLVWQILVYLPLQIIQAMVTLFNFFANGFSSTIFSSSFDGETWHYQFDLTSGIGQITMFTLIIALLLFFGIWVFNLGVKKGPIANKFKQFKWPLYMFFALIAFPIIMIISDSLLSPLLMAFTSTAPIKLMSIDVSNLNSYCLGNSDNCDFQLLATIGSKVQVGGSFLQNYLDTYVTNLNKAIDKMQAEMAKGDDAKQEFGILATYLGDLKVSITKVQSYVDKDLAALQGKINNFFTSLGMIPSQGIFMTKEESDTIHGFINSLNDFSSSFYDLSTLSDKMGSSYCDVGWDSLAKLDETFTKNNLYTPLKNIINSFNDDKITDIGYYVNGRSSIIYRIINGCEQYNGLSYIRWCTNSTPPLPLVQALYSAITGNPGSEWDQSPSLSYVANMNLLNFILGGFACWSMILIIYTFVASAVKRTYYILGYWIIGFFYIANGQNDAKSVPNWYKTIFGKWIGVLVMYILFNLAGVIMSLIQPAVTAGLTSSDWSFGNNGQINLLASLGVILSIQAAYETAYQISQQYLSAWGAKDEKFSNAEMFGSLKQGAALLQSTTASAKQWTGTLTGYTAGKSIYDWNETRKENKEKKIQAEEKRLKRAEMSAGLTKKKQEMREKGYDLKETTGSALKDFFLTSQTRDNTGKVNGREMNAIGRFFNSSFAGLESNNHVPNWLGMGSAQMSEERKAEYKPLQVPAVNGLNSPPNARASRPVDQDARDLVSHLNGQTDSNGIAGEPDPAAWYGRVCRGPADGQSHEEWQREADAYNNMARRLNSGEDVGLTNPNLKKLRQAQNVHEDTGKLMTINTAHGAVSDPDTGLSMSPFEPVQPNIPSLPNPQQGPMKYSPTPPAG